MKNNYPIKNKLSFFIAISALLIGNLFIADAQVAVPFTQRTSQYSPSQQIYNIKGDFTMIGNTVLTLEDYGDNTNNNNNHMEYVDTDASSLIGLSGVPTFNSSSSTIVLSSENGAIPSCSKIVYAGLYWTGRTKNSGNDSNTWNVSKNINGVSYNKTFDKHKICLKGPNASSYTTFTSANTDIFFPNNNYDWIYSSYVEVTDYVRTNGIGEYFAADIASREGNGGGTGYSGGWGMIIVYENSKMKYRDVTIFDGHAYVLSSNTSGFNLPVSGFNTVQVGPVGVKMGLMASEGDVGLVDDYFRIRKNTDNTYVNLSHSLNSPTNFFNGSVNTGGNPRNPTILNNTGIDISMFNVPNPGNTVLGNNQTSTNFKYGTGGDTYAIFAIAMAVDAYIPEVLGILSPVSINNVPVTGTTGQTALPGQEIEYKVQLINRGSEPINNAKITIPVPYNASYVANSATRQIFYTPVPTPNSVTFNPTIGANGSLIWNIGSVPLPGDPTTILGEMTYRFKVTEDCTILKNSNCANGLAVNGTVDGVGAITGTILRGKELILGYTTTGVCEGVEIHAPLVVNINATAYVNANCQATPPVTAFTFCNSSGTTIPITDVIGGFPTGSLFYNQYPVTANAIQYTINNGFPSTIGTNTYYAVPPGNNNGCFFQFTITVTTLTTQPTTANVQYCQGQTALPLTATPSVPGYTLYYYTSQTSAAQMSITPSTATVGTTTYYVAQGQSSNCIGPKKPITVTVNAIPNSPLCTITIQPTCTVATGTVAISGLPSGTWTLTQTGTANNTYTGNSNSYLVGNLAPGSYTFTVSTNGCTSGESAVVVINPQPATPAALVCLIETQPTCTVGTGSVIINGLPSGSWTIHQTGTVNNTYTGSGSPFTVTGLVPGNYTFSVTNSAGCTSTASASVVINPQPATPATLVCLIETQPTCTVATGSVIVNGLPSGNWTINQTGTANNTYSGSGSSFTISGLAPGAYTFTVTNNLGCTSIASESVVINPQPATPAAPISGGNQTVCQTSPIQVLTATATAPAGATIVWYTAATGGTIVANPTLNTVGSVTYYAQANTTAANCPSLSRTPVTLTITPAPVAPTVTASNITECEHSPIQTLTATATAPAGATIVWYTAATGGTIVASPTLNTVGTVTYYAQANTTASTCSSLTRTAVTLTINAAPAAPTVTASNITECEQSPIQTLTATATAPAGATIVWYTAAVGGTIVANPILNTVGTVTYYAQANTTASTCSSLTRTAVTLTITNAPVSPVSGGDQTQCEQSPIQTLTATATAPAGQTIVWYTAATGGTIVANPILNTVGTVTYYAQASGGSCSSLTRTAVTLTINAAPVAPTVTATNITECEQSPIQTLTATATAPAGATIVWYTAAVGGTIVANPILNTVGTVTYYAQANTTASACSSLTRTAVTLTINAAPIAPTVTATNITECEQSPIQTLTATATAPAGVTIVWYDAATGGNIVANPTLNTVGTVTYYAQANTTASACSSLTRTAVTLTINAAPVAPTVTASNIIECEQSPIQTLTATATAPAGATIVWYTAATGGTIVASPTLNTVGTVTYYAQANTTASTCSSLTRTAVTLTINAAPAAPTVSASNITECEQSPIQTLTATATAPAGATIVWYTAAVGGTIVANPILNTVGTVTYYAQANTTASTCSSLTRTAVTLTITNAPVSPVSGGDQTQCEQSPIQTLTATATAPAGQTIVWYTAATGGTIVANPILNTVGTVTYYAQASGGSCSSLTRTAVTLTINAAPVAPTVTATNITECEQSPIQTLTATATAPAGATIVWYTAAVGGTIVANPILNTVGTVTYYAQANTTASACSSLTRTAVTLTINAAPIAPTVTATNITECEQSPIQTLTATATAPAGVTIVWYDAATGGNIVTNPTLNTVGTVTYYAQANTTASACSSLTRTAVTLTINAAPVAPTVTASNITECEQSPIQTLTATATAPAGATIVWYTAAVGGTIVANPILNTVGTVTYYAQANTTASTCSSLTRTAVTLTINAAPAAPTVTASNITECEQSPIQTLTATATAPAGATIVWYDAATGGNIVANPILNTVGTVTYYAQANTDDTTCSSLTRTAVTLTITNAPVSPISGGDQTECEQSPIQTLTATATVPAGQTVVWYDAAVGGNVVTDPILNTVGTVTYYAQASGGSCSSLTRTPVTLTINPAAVAPTVTATNITECEQSPIQTLTATATVPGGATIVWYDAATGGNIVANPILNTVGTVTYYAQANTDDTACSSLTRTAVTLTINAAPVAPTVTATNITECEQSPIQTLNATATVPGGATIVWYDAATGGNIVANPILNTVGTVTYYAQANTDDTTCSSLTRTAVTLTINAAPVAPTVTATNITECEQSPIQTLTATATAPAGATIVWYDAATGGNIVANPILNTVGTVTYYAQANTDDTTCSSLTRTAVTLTITNAPVSPISGGDQTECEQSPIQTLAATATVPAGQTVVWYDAAVGGNVVTDPILNTVGTVTYYAQASGGSCSSLTRTAVTLTINAAPVAPTVTATNITECEQSPIQTLTATATVPGGATIVWYDAATGGNIVANPILNTVGTVTYYAQANTDDTACSSLTRTAVTLTINAAPVAPTVTATNITECEQSPIQTLTATATVPGAATIVWYDAATGGNIVANPILNTVGTVTYYAQANIDDTTCSSLTRTAVTLTINAAPVAPTVTATNITECEQSPIQTLTATATAPGGATIVWYDAAIGGNIVANPILNTVGTVTYYAQANTDDTTCSSLIRTAVTLTINAAPVAPTVTTNSITECEQSPIQTLTATATVPGGATIVWYDAATGGNIVANPILNTVGTVTYYAQANTDDTTCSSLTRTAVTLTINAAPVAPTVTATNITECEQSPIQTLTATATAPGGATIVWYDAATGGNIVANPILNTVGTVTYYAQANTDDTTCSSLTRTAVTLTINAAPVAPTVTTNSITECEQSPIQTLTATATVPGGATIVWYDAATGGNIVANPILNTVGTVTYYAQANTDDTTCSSLTRTAVTLTITTAPAAPTVTTNSITECEQSPIQTLTATATVPTGLTVVWFDAATGGNIVTNPTLNTVGTVTYYAEANGGTCSSLTRTAVTLTITPAPLAPTVTTTNITECEQSPIQTLTATATAGPGETVTWYDAAIDGNIVANPTLNTVGTVTYYAQAGNASACSSLTRTAVTLTITPAPLAPTVITNSITECEQSPIQTLTATATAGPGETVTWYDAATGGNIVANPTLNTVGTVTYYAQAGNASACSSLTRTAVTLTITPAPAAPITGGDQQACDTEEELILTATATASAGATIVWYDAAVGGNVVADPSLNTVGTVTYWAEATAGTAPCSSLTRTPVTLTISESPDGPISGGDQTACAISPIQTLTATATVPAGQTIVWYDAITGGNIVANPTLNTVGTVTYYAEATLGTCSSVTRTAVTLTINAAPSSPVLANITGECSVTAPTPTLVDNCGVTLTATTTASTTYTAQGTYVITWNFVDANGNTIVSADQTLIVQDTQAPVPVVGSLDDVIAQCSASLTPPQGLDNCAGTVTATTTSPSLTFDTQGTFVVTWVFSDGNGNNLSANQTVIIHDTTAPIAPLLADVSGPCSVTVAAPSTTDGCTNGGIVGTTNDPTFYDVAGTYLITWTFTDANGNSVTATQNATVTPAGAPQTATSTAADCNDDDAVTYVFDLNTILVQEGVTVPAGGTWTTTDPTVSGHLTGSVFSPYQVPVGPHIFTYTVTTTGCPQVVDLTMIVDDNCNVLPIGDCVIEPNNAFSPNGDGINEFFYIANLDDSQCFIANTVEIYNRWGVLVFDTNHYDNNTTYFSGKSEGRVTVDKGSELPTGTYFYIIKFTRADGRTGEKDGYLYLTR